MRDSLKVLAVLLTVVVVAGGSDGKSSLSVPPTDCDVVAVSEGTPVGSEMYVFHLPSYVSNVTVVSPHENVLEDWGVRVDSDSGQVIAIGRLDREERDWVQIDAFITDYSTVDAEPLSVSVCLNITDENDCSPEWTMQPYPYLAAVTPGVPPGTAVYQLTAHDADLHPNNVFSFYEIAGRSQFFQLNATYGTISTRGRPLVAGQEYDITVMAQDTAGNQSPRVTVSILAGRRPPQFFREEYTVDVDENQPVGTIVLTVQAKSFADLPVTYSFVGGGSSAFSLNDTTGAMTVVSPLSYDVMSSTIYLNVLAAELGFHGMASITRVTIHLREVDETTVPPPITLPATTVPPPTTVTTDVASTRGTTTASQAQTTMAATVPPTSGALWTTQLHPHTSATDMLTTSDRVNVTSATNSSSTTPITPSNKTIDPTVPVSVTYQATSEYNVSSTTASSTHTSNSSHTSMTPTATSLSPTTTVPKNQSIHTTSMLHNLSKSSIPSTDKPQSTKPPPVVCPPDVTAIHRDNVSFPWVTDGQGATLTLTLTWPETTLGRDAYSLEQCPPGSENAGHRRGRRRCRRDGSWGRPVPISCHIGLQELTQRPVTYWNAEEVASTVQIFTMTPGELHIHDVISTAELLEGIVLANDTVSEEVGQSVMTSISQLMNVDTDTLLEGHVINNVTNRILNTLETLSSHVTPSDRDQPLTMVESNLCMQVLDINLTQTFPGHGFLALALPADQEGSFTEASVEGVADVDSVQMGAVDAAIHIPPDLVDYLKTLPDRPESDIVRLTFTIFQNSRLFQTTAEDSEDRPDTEGYRHAVNSRVVASSVVGLSVRDLSIPIQTSFKPTVTDQHTNNTECVYWDFSLSLGKGGWSTEGCWQNRTEEGRVVCYCDHLTNFAVLMDIYGQGNPLSAADVFALDIISKIGCSLSIAGLSFTLLTAAVFRRFRSSTPQIILIQLSIALLGVLITFLAGIERVDPSAGCIAVAAFLHYFLLAGMMWMAVEAFSMYMAFVKVMSAHISRFVLKVSLIAWGAPLIIVVVTLAVDVNHYRGGDEYCWMALTPLYYAFMLPAGLIVLFNLVVFILIVKELYCKRTKSAITLRKSKKVTGPPPPRHKETLQRFRVAVTIFVVLGLTWAFGFLAISGARTVFAYLFCIFNSLQGFLIFIFFCVRQKEVRDRWFFLCAACFNRQYSFSEVMVSRSMDSNSNLRTPGSTPAFGRKSTCTTNGVKAPYSHQNSAKLMMNGTTASHNGTVRNGNHYNTYTYRNKGYKADTISTSSKSTTDGAEDLQPDTV
ncbi:ADGRG4 [Branchiostoma lanceolatum]|uniref:ADGRG4 protein n=1 Tax=Branchiostoma lanceolatum TaxID=7740 RepID=A0A8K0F176_BRALA|nr:ADGRG4 [Branchiostoma lanceolatum]